METTESPIDIQNSEPVIEIQDISSPEIVPSDETVKEEDDIPDWLRGSDNVTEAATDASLENASVLTHPEPSPEDISPSVKEEVLENDWKKSKTETIDEKKKKTVKKKTTPRKTKMVPSDHLLTSEHDMLLPSHTSDNAL